MILNPSIYTRGPTQFHMSQMRNNDCVSKVQILGEKRVVVKVIHSNNHDEVSSTMKDREFCIISSLLH